MSRANPGPSPDRKGTLPLTQADEKTHKPAASANRHKHQQPHGLAETAEADVWLIEQPGLGLVSAGSYASTAGLHRCVCMCVRSEHTGTRSTSEGFATKGEREGKTNNKGGRKSKH